MENNNEIEQLNNQLQILNLSEDKECSGEIWRQIKGHRVVRNIRTNRILKAVPYHKYSSLMVNIRKDDEKKFRSIAVAKLVALTFMDCPENFKQIRHKSCDLSDNSVENLYFI